MNEHIQNVIGSALGHISGEPGHVAENHIESGQVEAAETKTVQSGLSATTGTTLFLLLIGVTVGGVILLRTTSWYRHKKH